MYVYQYFIHFVSKYALYLNKINRYKIATVYLSP